MLQVIDLVLSFGGDVMKFAGDSMIIAFSPAGDEKSDLDEGLRASTLRCLQCASALAMQLGEIGSLAILLEIVAAFRMPRMQLTRP